MITKQASIVLSALFMLLQAACNGSKPAVPVQEQAKAPPAKTRAAAPPAGDPVWGYEASEGPSKWGSLSPKWAVCSSGKMQSPIDIEKTARMDLPELRAEFKPAVLKIVHHEHMADVINTGHSIQVNYTEGDTLKVGGEEFQLLQYHFHSPSEHTVGGKHFPIEMHMVHKSANEKLAVVGVFIEEGKHNSAFDPVWSNLPSSKSVQHHLEHVTVDVNQLLPTSKTTYRYDGSLTTPPCSEGVKWIVMTDPVQISAQQINAFRNVMKDNNRPVQPLNARKVVTDRIAETSVKK
jgi:carbonic anhydrase